MICGDQIWVVNDRGRLTVAEASEKGYRKLGAWEIFTTVVDGKKKVDGKEAWGPLAVAEGRLIMRDLKRMVCLDLRKMK